MSMPKNWIKERIAEARAGLEVIDEAGTQKFAELLDGRLSEKELRPKELAEVANAVLAVVLGHWPAPGLDDTDLSESGLPLELHRA